MQVKRKHTEETADNPSDSNSPTGTPVVGITRSISACQRCRKKKIRCDQKFPRCTKCEKTNSECVGLDPATGREVPRSYVTYLEERLSQLEKELANKTGNGKTDDFCSRDEDIAHSKDEEVHEGERKHRYNSKSLLDSTGLPFGKLMFAAWNIDEDRERKQRAGETSEASYTSESILPAVLPPKQTAIEFFKIFLSQSNPQLPIVHRQEFIHKYFIPVYGPIDDNVSLAINYSYGESDCIIEKEQDTWLYQYKHEFQKRLKRDNGGMNTNANEISRNIVVPRKFHKALFFLNMVFAIASSVHLLEYHSLISDSFKKAAFQYIEQILSSDDQLETLQGILLLSQYSIMRPSVPGVWYVLGYALRFCVDLGLHDEIHKNENWCAFVKDKRRRLFWCAYALDRQICFYLKRPVGIPEYSITTSFPSTLDDAFLVYDPNLEDYPADSHAYPSYKSISLAFLRLRQIQSEVQRTLYEKSEIPRKFADIQEWKDNIISRIEHWMLRVPKETREMNCDFNVEFFRINFFHTLLMIHGLSPRITKLSSLDFQKLFDASRGLIRCYLKLWKSRCINYTWAAVHNLFTAGSSYLYAIYNNEYTRDNISVEEIKETSQACINVLNSLVDRCDAAVKCRQTFEVLTAAVLKLKYKIIVKGNNKLEISPEQQTASNAPTGYVNSYLQSLVESLNSGVTAPSANRNSLSTHGTESKLPIDNSSIEENPTHSFQNLMNTPIESFKWIGGSNSIHEDNSYSQGDNLDEFFNKLESQILSASNAPLANQDSYSGNETACVNGENDFFSTQTGEPTDSYVTLESALEDHKVVYELLHQMSSDRIFDPFFANSILQGDSGQSGFFLGTNISGEDGVFDKP